MFHFICRKHCYSIGIVGIFNVYELFVVRSADRFVCNYSLLVVLCT